jgi:hypothetical protein
MDTKICFKCKEEKPLSEFYLKKNGHYHSYCNDCRCEIKKEWNTTHENEIKEYKLKNKEHIDAQNAKYRDENRGEINRKMRDNVAKYKPQRDSYWSKPKNKKRSKANRVKWVNANRERYNGYFKIYYAKYPERKIIRNLMTKLNKLVKGKLKALHCADLVGCDIMFFKEHIASQFKEGMSWDNYGFGDDKWHIDHIRPCESFDIHDPEQQRQCFYWTNLQPLWQPENISKNSKYNGVLIRKKNKLT